LRANAKVEKVGAPSTRGRYCTALLTATLSLARQLTQRCGHTTSPALTICSAGTTISTSLPLYGARTSVINFSLSISYGARFVHWQQPAGLRQRAYHRQRALCGSHVAQLGRLNSFPRQFSLHRFLYLLHSFPLLH
jgi:hypothetical protein